MKYSMKSNKTILLIAATAFCHISGANAAVTVTVTQVGPNVVFSGSGAFNLSAFVAGTVSPVSGAEVIDPSQASLVFPLANNVAPFGHLYTPATVGGPSSYGTGTSKIGEDSAGDSFGIQFFSNASSINVWVPENYVSNSPLSATMTFVNDTFATLGLTEGSYTWNWSSDGNNDSMTVNVIPEPTTSLLGALTLAAVSMLRRRSPRV